MSPEDELLYGRGNSGRVFVSSQMRAGDGSKVYEGERGALADAISALPFLHPWRWETDAPVGDYSAEPVCIRVAGTSECLVLVLGAELTPTTRKEYEAAHEAGAHCFVFQDRRETAGTEVASFIKEARASGSITGRFGSADELAERAATALQERALYSMRKGIVAARSQRGGSEGVVEDRDAPWNDVPMRRYKAIQLAFGEAPERPETFTTVEEMLDNFRAQAEAGGHQEVFEALREVAFEVYENGFPDIALELIDELRDMVPPGKVDPAEEAWASNTEGLALARLGRDSDADRCLNQMREVGQRAGDKDVEATALQNLAVLAINVEDYGRAEQLVRESADLKSELEDTRALLQLMNSLVLIATAQGEYEKARETLDFYEQMAREARDDSLLESAHGNRGGYFVAQGDLDKAEEQYRLALHLSRKGGDPSRQLVALRNMGAVCSDQGRIGEAMRWYRKGLKLAHTYGLEVEAEILHRALASVLHRAARRREAIEEFDRAKELAFSRGDTQRWAESTMNIGAIYLETEDAEAAIEPLEQAVSAFRQLGDFEWELGARSNLSVAREMLGEAVVAKDLAEDAVRVLPADAHEKRAAALRRAAEAAMTDSDLVAEAAKLFSRALDEEAQYLAPAEVAWRAAVAGAFLDGSGATEHGLPFFDRAVEGLEGTDRRGRLFDALGDRAVALSNLGRLDEARKDLCRASALAQELDDPTRRQRATGNLAEVERRRGATSDALSLARDALEQAQSIADPDVLRWAAENLALAVVSCETREGVTAAVADLEALGSSSGDPGVQAEALQARAHLSWLRSDFEGAAELYEQAVRLHHDAGNEDVFALGALVESRSRAGQRDGLEEPVQKLIDLAGSGEDYESIITALCRSAAAWLDHDEREEAASLFGLALLIGIQAAGSEGQDDDEGDRLVPFFLAVGALVQGVRDTTLKEDDFYDEVFRYLDREHDGAGDKLRPSFDLGRKSFDERSDSSAA